MKQLTIFFAVGLSLMCGCASAKRKTGHGEVGAFILHQAISYGGSPITTNGLPATTSHWSYSEDSHGVMISISRRTYAGVESFLSQAFAGQSRFGPKVGTDGGKIVEYRLTSMGGGIQLSSDEFGTHVIILRPFTREGSEPPQGFWGHKNIGADTR